MEVSLKELFLVNTLSAVSSFDLHLFPFHGSTATHIQPKLLLCVLSSPYWLSFFVERGTHVLWLSVCLHRHQSDWNTFSH